MTINYPLLSTLIQRTCCSSVPPSLSHTVSLSQDYIPDYLTPAEFVGLYIILHLQNKYPQKWMGYILKEKVIQKPYNEENIQKSKQGKFCILKFLSLSNKQQSKVSQFLEAKSPHKNQIHQNHKNCLTLKKIFSHFQLFKVPKEVQYNIICWLNTPHHCKSPSSFKNFPLRLYFYVPTSWEVLNLQSDGNRCLTCLLFDNSQPKSKDIEPTLEEPTKKTKKNKVKMEEDELEFLFHDFQHFSKFYEEEYYYEQVGFFEMLLNFKGHRKNLEKNQENNENHEQISINNLKIPGESILKECKIDNEYFQDIDRVSSDMNGSCLFLFSFLKAKLERSFQRNNSYSNEQKFEDKKENDFNKKPNESKDINELRQKEKSQVERNRLFYFGSIENQNNFDQLFEKEVRRWLNQKNKEQIFEIIEDKILTEDHVINAMMNNCTPSWNQNDSNVLRTYFAARGKVILLNKQQQQQQQQQQETTIRKENA